jgi:hypothetical protein
MATPVLDPTLPADNSLISAGELRANLRHCGGVKFRSIQYSFLEY